MAASARLRVSLGELMVFVALAAGYLGPELSTGMGNAAWYFLGLEAVNVATIGLLYFHRRLSGWIWLVLASWYVHPIFALARGMGLPRSPGPDDSLFLWASFLGSALLPVGLGMLLRDVRRRLAAAERPRPAAPDDDDPATHVSWGP